MTTQSKEHKLFKLFLRSIASDDLVPSDYQNALADLRNPKMMGLLEDVLAALAGEGGGDVGSSPEKGKGNPKKQKQKPLSERSANQLVDDIKRRKITRDRLENILRSVDAEFAHRAHEFDTMRSLISSYRNHASDREWDILSDIVNGNYELDPYFNSAS
ncbi:MAG: hypothetical protein WA978_14385 [Sphingopyxis granuli]|uniref:hypothetical protein n=1 Tax=Sphingopyxis granuli TaxID=267128 RepID=UPI003C7600C9